jgi:hypothetical protein
MEIARGVGTPLLIDKATKERQFGYFARVFVDVDLAGELPSSLMVEREAHCFPIEVVYENLCAHCRMVDHTVDHCKHLTATRKPNVQGKQQVEKFIRQEYLPKPISNEANNVSEPHGLVSDHQIVTPVETSSPIVHEVVQPSSVPLFQVEHDSVARSPDICSTDRATAQYAQLVIQEAVMEDEIVQQDEPSGQLPLHNANLEDGDGVENVGVVTNNIIVAEHADTLVDNDYLGPISIEPQAQKFCWGDLENKEPLGYRLSTTSEPSFDNSWLDEGNATLDDENLLQTLPKTRPKKLKIKQCQLSSRPTRTRMPIVRLNL